jgi:prevent-host-death family protein
MATWQVQQAKTRLSELIADAQAKGPQIITKHGVEVAVVLSLQAYNDLKASQPPQSTSIKDFLLNSPPVFETDEEYEEFLADCMAGRQDTGREIDLFLDDADVEAAHAVDIAA